jgi:DNA-binding transcriptional LysR family regulator
MIAHGKGRLFAIVQQGPDIVSFQTLLHPPVEAAHPGGKIEIVKTRPQLHANSGDICVAAALQDQGIILQPDFLVYEALREGKLEQVLKDYQVAELGIYAVYSSRRQMPLKLRALIDYLVEAFRQPAWALSQD